MPPSRIVELLIGAVAAGKLGARGIAAGECRELLANGPLVTSNPHAGQPGRCLMIGRSSGGRRLTLVIEPTLEPTTWIVVTGWDSSPRERRLLGEHS